jgi:pyruvate formate lyase activating enzyme
VETAGYVPWENILCALDDIDLMLFDIKHLDSAKHKSGTGQLNDLILENVRKIVTMKPLWIRVPLIPGFNDSPEIIRGITEFVKQELRPVSRIELQAYNKMGEGKYKRLGRQAVCLKTQEKEQVQALNLIALLPGG